MRDKHWNEAQRSRGSPRTTKGGFEPEARARTLHALVRGRVSWDTFDQLADWPRNHLSR